MPSKLDQLKAMTVVVADTGDLVISAGLDTGNLERTLKLILRELRRLKEARISRAELGRAQDYVIGQMDLSLPADTAKAAHKQEQVDQQAKSSKEETLELPSDLTVIIRTQQDGVNNGIISALTLEQAAGQKPVNDLKGLAAELAEAKKTASNDAIKIQGDGKLKWSAVVQVMDVCRKAGFNNISFVPPPDFGLGGQ